MLKVSVIVPVYGVEKYIERCARSLFEQTLDDIEYIFVDDCSPDGSILLLERVIEEYPKRKRNVKIVRSECNCGPAICRKIGFDNSLGEYIIFCDSDDWVSPEMYEKLYVKAIEGGYDVCISDYRMVEDDSYGERIQSFYEGEDYLTNLLRCRITGSVWNKLVRRSRYCAEGFVWPTMSFCEDYVCSAQIAMMAPKVGYVPEALYNYFKHPGSIVSSRTKEQILKKQKENLANYHIVESAIMRNKIDDASEALTVYRLAVKNYIRSLTKDKEILHQWRNTFPGLGKDLWKSRYISFRVRIVYVITYLGLYRLFV